MLNKLSLNRSSTLRNLLVFGLACAAALTLITAPAHADTTKQKDDDALYTYCRNYLRQHAPKAIEGCDSREALNRARSAAALKCNTPKNRADCILREAKSLIRDAASPAPSNAAKFKEALTKTANSQSADPAIKCDGDRCDFVGKYINPAIALLSAAFGLIVIASIIMGGIQYSSSQGDPQKVTKAKERIFNTVFALIAYIFLYAFLQFLIPGGLFNR